MSDVFVQDVTGELLYTFDFSADVPLGVTVTSIDVTAPAPLALFASSNDYANKRKTVGLRGFLHGAIYQVLAVATLDSSEKQPKTITVRGMSGT